jgi:2-polyprenyl-3-methyl-5-hydroxy-6-metoxy-1,4-benzoquinol methylase
MAALPDDSDPLADRHLSPAIRVEPVPGCPICGASGTLAYQSLTDCLCGVPGEWRLRRCSRDGALWLDPRPIMEDLGRCYPAGYFTHGPSGAKKREGVDARRDCLRRAILARCFGYNHLVQEQRLPTSLAFAAAGLPSLRAWAGYQMGASMLPYVPDGRLLDVGCGNGSYLLRMRALGWEVAGIEPDAAAVRRAVQEHGLAIHAGTMEDAPFDEAAFDTVTSRHVLEHVPDPRAFVRSLGRFLKPGGRLVIVTPNASSLGHRLLRRDFYALDPPRHLVLFTVPAIRTLFAQAGGLRVLSVRTPIHIARKVFKQGRVVRRTGAFAAPGFRSTLADRLGGALFSGAEGLGSTLWPLGEEIELTAVKEG